MSCGESAGQTDLTSLCQNLEGIWFKVYRGRGEQKMLWTVELWGSLSDSGRASVCHRDCVKPCVSSHVEDSTWIEKGFLLHFLFYKTSKVVKFHMPL